LIDVQALDLAVPQFDRTAANEAELCNHPPQGDGQLGGPGVEPRLEPQECRPEQQQPAEHHGFPAQHRTQSERHQQPNAGSTQMNQCVPARTMTVSPGVMTDRR
jgi:hypothetical protein